MDSENYLWIQSKILLMSLCEDYTRMTQDYSEKAFSNFPIVKANSPLQEGLPFAVSFVGAEDGIIIDVA